MSNSQGTAVQVRIVPKLSIIRTGLLSALVVPLPVFGALLLLGLGNGSWPVAIVGELLSLTLCVLGLAIFRRTFVSVTSDSIVERGFLGRLLVSPLESVETIVMAHTYVRASSETIAQLIVRDRLGRRLLRLRGNYWTEESMTDVAEAISSATGVELYSAEEPLTRPDFFAAYPGTAYWFENRPTIAVTAAAGILALVICVVLGTMWLVESPVAALHG